MRAFTQLTAISAPLPIANIDTDKIIPGQFCKTIKRTGLGVHLFHALRYEGEIERPEFILNQGPYRSAEILVTLENFGCGSSREHAPWALLDFGIRCIIAPSFADIFYNNCFKNGILPVRLSRLACETLMEDARAGANARLSIDLNDQVVIRPDGEPFTFEVDAMRRAVLLEGLDDISVTMKHLAAIDAHEKAMRARTPWLFSPAQFRPV